MSLCVRMLTVGVVLAATAAAAETRKPIDLDKDENAARRLAEAAGACRPTQPAFIRTWCNTKKPRRARFTQRVTTTARDAGDGALAISVPVSQHGKGFVSAIVQPPVTCTASTCEPAWSVEVAIRTKGQVAAADVRAVMFTFDVDRMWRDHQWWGPTPTNLAVMLLGDGGKQLGAGVLK